MNSIDRLSLLHYKIIREGYTYIDDSMLDVNRSLQITVCDSYNNYITSNVYQAKLPQSYLVNSKASMQLHSSRGNIRNTFAEKYCLAPKGISPMSEICLNISYDSFEVLFK